jgi:hypothetical protein
MGKCEANRDINVETVDMYFRINLAVKQKLKMKLLFRSSGLNIVSRNKHMKNSQKSTNAVYEAFKSIWIVTNLFLLKSFQVVLYSLWILPISEILESWCLKILR